MRGVNSFGKLKCRITKIILQILNILQNARKKSKIWEAQFQIIYIFSF